MSVLARRFPRPVTQDAATDVFAGDVIAGLSAKPKMLLPKYFYDSVGSQLFERITLLPEYYPTRTELGILHANARALAELAPKDAVLVEFGAGSAVKAKILLNAAPQIASYVPVDISAEFLADEARRLERDIPRIGVFPVAADFTAAFELPDAVRNRPRIGFFPGSTIGNFDPAQAKDFLRQAAQVLGPDALFIVGADRVKDEDVLFAAYNDSVGVTAQFNLNLLTRINRELGGSFEVDAFRHFASYNHALARIEMYLESVKPQVARVRDFAFSFAAGETIHTESSHKFTLESFTMLAADAGWTVSNVLSDEREYFSVYVLRQD